MHSVLGMLDKDHLEDKCVMPAEAAPVKIEDNYSLKFGVLDNRGNATWSLANSMCSLPM